MGAVSPTILSWITTEVNQALKLVRDNIAKFTAAPDDEAALAVCPGHLHQVSGALRMVGLTGATRFCETIEGSFIGLTGAKAARSIGTVDKAVQALKDFVDDLERGQANVPLRLYPFYRDLAALQGRTDPSEKELFFPDLTEEAPAHASPVVLKSAELAPYLQAQRARFQKGLLASLRNQPGGLEEMRAALDAMHQVAGMLPEPRGLWWAAVGLVDALKGDKDAPPPAEWLSASKVLCNKLDFQIRDLAAGGKAVNEQMMRELLYALAKSKSASGRVKVVKTHYQLDGLFPEPSAGGGVMEFNMEWLQPALNDARSRLEALKSVWVQYISGEPKSAPRFRELVASFKAKAGELGSQPLVKLLDVISLVAAKLPDPYPQQSQLLVIEMASAFLLAESVIDTFTAPPPDVEQQITIMGGWLLDAAKGKSTGEPPARLRSDLSQQISALQLRAQVAKEILANLHHVEQVLDAFARDAGKRHTLKDLDPFLRQIRGALNVLGFDKAAEMLQICDAKIQACSNPDHPQTAEDMDWVAEGLSSLGFFLDPCLKGREPVEQAITLFFERYEKSTAPAPQEPVIEPVIEPVQPEPVIELVDEPAKPAEPAAAEPAAAPAAQQPAVNEELLAIYLEEAGEVLGNISGGLATCRQQPNDRDALTTIRRGFHTLKGSGRMVGLTDLGEIAWQIEQVMNRWLEQQRAATPRLLELIAMASEAFGGWVEQLRAKQPLVLDAQAITELAQRLKSDQEPEPEPVVAAAPPAPAPEPAPEQEEITIGSTRLLRSFLEIYLSEASQHVAALQSEFPRWRAAPGEASHEFHRAAHTLASSSRTAGFTAIADLAGALEMWMPLARHATRPEDAQTIESAILKLKDMVGSLSAREVPASMQDALNAMQQMTLRLQMPAAAPVAEPKAPLAVVKPAAPAPTGKVKEKEKEPEKASASVAKPGGRENRVMRDDIDDQLLPIFLEEAQELLPHIGSDLRDWKANTADQNVSASLRRALHTLKGSARMAGAIRLGELTHIMESRIEAAIEAEQFTSELFADLEDKMDRLSLDLERMGGAPSLAAAPAAPAAAAVPADKPAAEAPEATSRVEVPLPGAAMLRVNADTLDHLINESGEVSIARSRVEAELRHIKQALSDLNDSIARMRGQLREVEVQADSQMQSRLSVLEERDRDFDPLEFDRYTRLQELTRLMAESLHDATSIQQGLQKNLGETEAALTQQARTSRDVQQQLMHMRAVPFSNLNERLYRIVRQTARELGKKAELDIQGSQVELDRGVLEKISAPLEHMLRNALAHGLEMPEARLAAGKPESGRISITLRQESNEMALIMSDDGAGLDLDKLRAKALARGVLREDETVSEHDLMGLVFVSGLSTADKVTELSGRGVGMDVVKNDLTSIGGRIDIASRRGQGTTFTVYLPLTLAVTQAVLVRAGESVLAFSSATVEQVLRLKEDALAGLYEKKEVQAQDHSYPLYYLRDLLGGGAPAGSLQGYNSVLLVRSGIQRVALHVDELIGNQEIVVKNIGPQLARVAGVGGATVLPDGRIVLIVNPVQLAQRARGASVRQVVQETPAEKAPAPVIMVVDDSLTVRKITSRLLEREGYRVMTAKDGLDALQQMRDTLPAVMLVDIEMPRMDGFDLARNVRGDPRTHHIPIVIISSRTADKHRNQAAQLGVNAFLGKPYEESELLSHILNFLGAASQPATYH